MKKLLTLVVLFVFVASISAKETASPEANAATTVVATKKISAVLFDKVTKENLAGAMVTVNGQKVYTDLDGKFEISNPTNSKLQVTVNLISYESKVFEIDPSSNSNLTLELNQR